MINGFIAKKISNASVYTEDGRRIQVTRCSVQPLTVTQVKTKDKDGYQAVQFAYGTKKSLDKAVSGKMSKLKLELKPQKFVEFDLTTETIPEVGSQVTFDSVLAVGDKVKVTGISKGKGFAGVIKRYNFQRQPVSGGQSDRVRAPGAIGAQTPGKVLKGKKMPGHMGNEKVSILKLKVYAYNPESKELLITGSIPGPTKSWFTIFKD
ncbi:MAG TPA: 50S ribosomal protein L3 [Candidatus Woesebacteria bacterium]|nr:50S ribosomal protein L3 [Candidatus Woesebacteria bacterium]HPJ16825.1 50S ribosomal protein L3 [Candidatus Woesebacteria bacterium]